MYSMTMATLGWGSWWGAFVLSRLFPDANIGTATVSVVGCVFGVLGLGLAALTIRARRTWLLFSFVAMFANVSLLAMPWLAGGARE